MNTRDRTVRCLLALGMTGCLCAGSQAPAAIIGFGDGTGYSLNRGVFDSTGPSIANNVLTLTDGGGGEQRTAFNKTRQDITGFQVHFVYQGTANAGSGLGDGVTFAIQNDGRGASAVGNGGGGLGYEGITPSVAIELNLFALPKVGTFLGINGTTGSSQGGYAPTAPVVLTGGDPIAVDLSYNGTTLTESLTDTTTGASFRTGYAVNIARIVGSSTAYVGFTGGSGLFTATQTISNFSMVTPEPASLVLVTVGLGIGLGVGAIPRRVRPGARPA